MVTTTTNLDSTDPTQISFTSKLATKSFTFDPTTAPTGLSEAGILGEGSEIQFNTLLESYGTNVSDPAARRVFPRTWQDFVTQVRSFFGNGSTDAFSGPLFDGFYNDYLEILKITQGDYAGIDSGTQQQQFAEVFTQFLKTYQFANEVNQDGTPGPNDGAAGPMAFFVSNFRKFMTVTALNQGGLATGSYSNLSVLRQIFNAYFPAGSDEQFNTLRNELVTEVRASDGYFLPSQMLNRWFDKVQDAYLTTQLAASSIKGTESVKLTILWKIFRLVVDMIGTLQQVATVLARRLSYLTTYQKAYTDLMATIPVFTKGDSSPFGGSSTSAGDNRQELNPKNQTLTENLRSFRTILSDQAKALQANINQLNESVNQQASLADAILQQMSTILQSIFR